MQRDSLRYPALAQRGQLGAIPLRNRIIMASLTRNRSTGTLPNDANVVYYRQRARSSGAALILTEGAHVEPSGSEWPNAPCLHDEMHAGAWKKIVDAVHGQGAQVVCQLMHIGRVGNNDMPAQIRSGKPIYGPSTVPARGGEYRQLDGRPSNSIPVSISNPRDIISLFVNAANMAQLAGFDGVELHGANGYMIDQFLSDISNTRSDDWGGSVPKRCRLALEVVRALIKVWGADRVGIKLSPCGGYNDMSYSSIEANRATFRYLIAELNKLKIAYVQLGQYNAVGDPHIGNVPQGDDYNVIEEYAHLLDNVKVVSNTGYDAARAEAEVSSGTVEAVAFGRMFLNNPDYYYRIQNGVPLNEQLVVKAFYQVLDGDITKGYSDYPFAHDASS